MDATYSPEDNKLRLYAETRLDEESYARVKASGFKWAPKQDLFVAPMWTPGRADLLEELCGEIGDEDTSLADRTAERAERFGEYSEKRAQDANGAHAAVERITSGIPLGQPILVGHHSERHARRDAKRIENGMRRAVKMWETSKYWKARAAGALRSTKYKERPDVRQRRIKKLEAEQRKQTKARDESARFLGLWEHPEKLKRKDGQTTTLDQAARFLTNHDRVASGLWYKLDRDQITPEGAQASAIESHRGVIAHAERWLSHIGLRLEYERAMLAGQGGTVADRTGPEKGGAVKCWASPRGGWSYVVKVNRVSVSVLDNWGNGGANFRRTIPFDKLAGVMTAAEVQDARDTGRLIEESAGEPLGFWLRDAPLPDPPKPEPAAEPNTEAMEAMRDILRGDGVQVVAAPQLFPTPVDLARRMAELAGIEPGHRVLEPSAGTGRLLDAVRKVQHPGHLIAVEHNAGLVERLKAKYQPGDATILQGDFLECNLGPFDRVVMNPPFKDGEDIRHIEHARKLLAPGGRLVALCAAGPRQEAALRPKASTWEVLPADSFKAEGTGVHVVLLTIDEAGSYEDRVRGLESEGLTRSDAQGAVDAEDIR